MRSCPHHHYEPVILMQSLDAHNLHQWSHPFMRLTSIDDIKPTIEIIVVLVKRWPSGIPHTSRLGMHGLAQGYKADEVLADNVFSVQQIHGMVFLGGRLGFG
jgi:hypothetical protein